MSPRLSSPYRLPGGTLRPKYTWQRRGPNFKGMAGLAFVLVAFMLVGSSVPGTSQALSSAWVWSGQRTDAGLALYELGLSSNMLIAVWDASEPETGLSQEMGGTAHESVPPTGAGWSIVPKRARRYASLAPVHGLGDDERMLQLAPADGHIVRASQSVAVNVDEPLTVAFAAHALSTMGDAYVTFKFYDNHQRTLATLGWLLVGSFPPTGTNEHWFDLRTRFNFQGAEAGAVVDVPSLLHERFGINARAVHRVEMNAVAADGQHLLIETAYVGTMDASLLQQAVDEARAVGEPIFDTPLHYVQRPEATDFNTALTVAQDPVATDTQAATPTARGTAAADASMLPPAPVTVKVIAPEEVLQVGDTFTVTATIQPDQITDAATITLNAPAGYGLLVDHPVQHVPAPGGTPVTAQWTVTAQRPHTVNLNSPWPLSVTVTTAEATVTYPGPAIAVVDPRPGRIFYVLTDDLEPMDSAGYPTRFTGNRNGWLDPEEFRVQLINKSEAINQIAEKHGALWSHFIAWPAVIGAQWAARQSDTDAWPAVIADLEASVQRGTQAGHQYTPHLHIDYDWRLDGAVLAYDRATDGFWANHRAHGWTHQLPRLGAFHDINSRTGTLYDYMARFEQLLRDRGQGQQLATRTGSFDFGISAADQMMSTEAFHRVGLWASSDAGGNTGGMTSAAYGANMYWARPESITQPAENLDNRGIIQFLPTPRRFIAHESETVASANAKVDEAIQTYAGDGTVAAGVHGIISFTHAMFLLGDGDWTSTAGGAFSVLDDHLAYVTETYADNGLLHYGTANDLTAAWLDYYTPELIAVRGPESFDAVTGLFTYPISLLGRDIPLGAPYEHLVTVKYPLYFTDDIAWAGIYRDDTLIAAFDSFPTPYNDLPFTVTAPGAYRLVIAPAQPAHVDADAAEHEDQETAAVDTEDVASPDAESVAEPDATETEDEPTEDTDMEGMAPDDPGHADTGGAVPGHTDMAAVPADADRVAPAGPTL